MQVCHSRYMTRVHKPRPRDYQQPILCGGKRRYPSRREAEIVKSEQEILTRDLELAIYHCQSGCGGWHLTRIRKL